MKLSLLTRLDNWIRRQLCKLSGHLPPAKGWWGDGLYGEVRCEGRDNVGRTHASIYLTCACCGEKYRAARFHPNLIDPAFLEPPHRADRNP